MAVPPPLRVKLLAVASVRPLKSAAPPLTATLLEVKLAICLVSMDPVASSERLAVSTVVSFGVRMVPLLEAWIFEVL